MDWLIVLDQVDGLVLVFVLWLQDVVWVQIELLWLVFGWMLLLFCDVFGLVVVCMVVMLVNEGVDIVWQGVCDEQGVDLVMKLGVNYLVGFFEWLVQIGVVFMVDLFDGLFYVYCSECYCVSLLLWQCFYLVIEV